MYPEYVAITNSATFDRWNDVIGCAEKYARQNYIALTHDVNALTSRTRQRANSIFAYIIVFVIIGIMVVGVGVVISWFL